MINEIKLERKAQRYKRIKKVAEKLKKQDAKSVDRRRDLEDRLYLKSVGVEL